MRLLQWLVLVLLLLLTFRFLCALSVVLWKDARAPVPRGAAPCRAIRRRRMLRSMWCTSLYLAHFDTLIALFYVGKISPLLFLRTEKS